MMQELVKKEFERGRRQRGVARIRVGSPVDDGTGRFGVAVLQSRNQLPIKRILPLRLPHPQTTATKKQRDNWYREKK